MEYLKDFTEDQNRKYDKKGFVIKGGHQHKTRAQKMIDHCVTRVRDQFIAEI